MIILDTNVISELMRPQPTPSVLEWANSSPDQLVCTCVTIFELEFGIRRLPERPRKAELVRSWSAVRTEFLDGHILVLDEVAGRLAAEVKASELAAGFTVDVCDLFIAAIAKRENAPVATRNVRHFDRLGIDVISPWLLPASDR